MSISHKRAEQENAYNTFTEVKNLITKLQGGKFCNYSEMKDFFRIYLRIIIKH